ncbi:MAG: DUF488 domain-containing protein [Gammaproteobacteria bacterium]
MARNIKLKRVYEAPVKTDGVRILVDRIWPRGLIKKQARIDYWAQDVAPSTKLRQWFGHDPGKWPEFKRRYHAELRHNKTGVAALKALLQQSASVTLVFGAHDEAHNNAVVLKSYLRR